MTSCGQGKDGETSVQSRRMVSWLFSWVGCQPVVSDWGTAWIFWEEFFSCKVENEESACISNAYSDSELDIGYIGLFRGSLFYRWSVCAAFPVMPVCL